MRKKEYENHWNRKFSHFRWGNLNPASFVARHPRPINSQFNIKRNKLNHPPDRFRTDFLAFFLFRPASVREWAIDPRFWAAGNYERTNENFPSRRRAKYNCCWNGLCGPKKKRHQKTTNEIYEKNKAKKNIDRENGNPRERAWNGQAKVAADENWWTVIDNNYFQEKSCTASSLTLLC